MWIEGSVILLWKPWKKIFIGFTGLSWVEYSAPFTPCVDIEWRLKREAWGKGYATRRAKCCLAFAFNDLELGKMIATAAVINLRSISVMKQAGMQPLLAFNHPALEAYPRLKPCIAYSAGQPLKRIYIGDDLQGCITAMLHHCIDRCTDAILDLL